MDTTHCELCSSESDLSVYEVTRTTDSSLQNTALLCSLCRQQIENPETIQIQHWHALHETIWTENPSVKVLAWRILNRIHSENWAQDLLDQLYMEDELLDWARNENTVDSDDSSSETSQARDSNGTALNQGDSVLLIKDLDVKGAGFTAKRGTVVKKISLTDDPGLVEGRINGTQIVLKTCFLKKTD